MEKRRQLLKAMQLLLFISCPVLTESINNTIIDYC